MGEAKKVDPYLVDRISITKNMDHAYLLEVGGLCPLCGKNLLAAKGNSKSKLYQIAHIYPNSPLPNEIKELVGLERLGINCEDFKNKIALCKDCHGIYDDGKTKDEYLNLVKIKKKLLNLANARVVASHQDLEEEIILVINALSYVNMRTLEKMKLEYSALKISDKIDDSYMILINKIESYVCTYFNFIKETFRNLEESGQINFNIIASQIKTSFLKCEKELSNKGDIFNSMVNWMHSQLDNSSFEACEVVVSYFVQNCEVFREITK
ncbi:ABC-three component system protein [Psychrobacillus sp. L3]|uniref:ABC-three component system protein n=1 Tax=Psychrobacillus sp. L3 TaxID=3236891 RepID=UPI0036F420BF